MDIISTVLFYIISFILITSALIVVFSPKIVYSVLFAFAAFINVGFIYFMLNAPFIGAAQIAIYGVALSVLFIFALMLTSLKSEHRFYLSLSIKSILGILGIIAISASVIIFAFEDYITDNVTAFSTVLQTAVFDTTMDISKGIFVNYIFAFELLSLFLLIAVIGIGVIISFKRPEGE